MAVVIKEANFKDLGYIVRGREASVVIYFGSITRFRLRVVWGPLYPFLSDEVFKVLSTTQMPIGV